MLTESEVRSRVREALEARTPPAPWLASKIQKSVEAQMRIGSHRRTPRAPRVSLRILAAAVLIVLLVAGAATFLIARYSQPRAIPAGPSSSSALSSGWAYGGDVAMVNPTDGWGYGLPFRHTTDGGVSWTDVTPKGVGQSFDEYYLDAAHAWVIDWSGAGPSQFATYLTADGARTWQPGSPTSISVDPGGLGDHEFRFVDPDHGWLLVSKRDRMSNGVLVYSDNLYRTSDGGLHWAIAAVHNAPLTWNPGKFYCYEWCGPMAFASATTGWLLTDSASDPTKPTLLVTHDAGVTWREQTLSLKSATIGCPCSRGPGPFLVFDDMHAVFQLYSRASRRIALVMTSDGGVTWTPRAVPAGQMKVGFYDTNHGWLIDQTALSTTSFTSPAQPLPLYRTADGGITWTRVPTNLLLQSKDGQIISVYFIDQRDGFAIRANAAHAGCDTPGDCPLVWSLLKTIDGGHTWSAVNPNV
jgi:photosystem II stability/assembly factor-like uncharacterized protein